MFICICIHIFTYISICCFIDRLRESGRQKRSTYVQMLSEGGFLNAPRTGSVGLSREDEKTSWIDDDEEALSDNFAIRESTQISSAASPPTYEEPYDF